jgi:hypothetical protein
MQGTELNRQWEEGRLTGFIYVKRALEASDLGSSIIGFLLFFSPSSPSPVSP